MKIKTKKQLNLPQLIEWISTNIESYRGRVFRPLNRGMANYILIHPESHSVKFNGMIFVDDLFTVEVEEELTEDTFFKHLIKVTEDGEHYSTDFFKVRDLIHLGTEEVHAYIYGEYKLIWTHEKGLVE